MKIKKHQTRNLAVSQANKTFNIIGLSGLSALALLALGFVTPSVAQSSSAFTNASDSAVSRVSVHNAAMVGIALDSRIDIDATPTSTGTFAIGNATLGITTNNPEGYKIFLSSIASNQLIGVSDAIDSITDTMVGTAFTGNTWGYSLEPGTAEATESTTYHAIPTSTQEIYNEPSATASEELYDYNLAFGVHITPSLMAGEYSNNIVVSVVANPNTISSLRDLVYMQDMTPDICKNTPSAYNHDTNTTDKNSPYYLEPITKQLYDLRDGNKYWVAKLADGECWMTQNLALNLGERPDSAPDYYSRYVKTLTPSDSDVTEDWTVPVNTTTYRTDPNDPSKTATEEIYGTEVGVPRKDITTDSEYYNSVRSWNLGKILNLRPRGRAVCVNDQLTDELANLGYTTPGNNAIVYGQSLTEICEQFVNVEGSGWQPSKEPIATATSSVIDGEYDEHYLIGNYYSWNAATAGSGAAARMANNGGNNAANTDPSKLINATNSICPQGWQLPVSGRFSGKVDGVNVAWPYDLPKSFYKLTYAYGYPATGSNGMDGISSWVYNGGAFFTTVDGSNKVGLDVLPIGVNRTGVIKPSNGMLEGIRNFSLASSTIGTYDNIYYYGIGSNTANNLFFNTEQTPFGSPYRCLAR